MYETNTRPNDTENTHNIFTYLNKLKQTKNYRFQLGYRWQYKNELNAVSRD